VTPGARVAAAIEVLDAISGGLAAEQALTRWARNSRFAGSKDRAAVRDHVFDVLRCRTTAAFLGGGDTGRALMIGLLRHSGQDLASHFDGAGHAPAALSPDEAAFRAGDPDKSTGWNLPEWLLPEFERSLGAAAEETALALQARAPVCLRVNRRKATRTEVQKLLAGQGVTAVANPLAEMALTVTEGARSLRASSAYRDGLIELQDAASQAVVEILPPAVRCLDYCAGGGGKALALASDTTRAVDAHDIDPKRMNDLPARALRAGVEVPQLATQDLANAAPYDLVLCDAPCSGSGAWRRAAEGKWRLTPSDLDQLTATQDVVLREAARLVAPGGWLIYVTCSVLKCENAERVSAFLASHPDWHCVFERQFSVSVDGDGFYTAHLTRV
jgi:16S rRNA (cytosine967-C5)-methyltransferase